MYRFIPQKKRSKLRVTLGVIFYSFLRYFVWIKYSKLFAKQKDYSSQEQEKNFPYIIATHSSPIFRNLSQTDTELQNGKANNLGIASKKVNCVELKPGQIFSYWRLIGNPTFVKGYKKGMMLENGKPVAKTGGGLCALSNLLYWMTLHTPLTVAERFRHSYDIFPDSNRTLPFGSGATCVYNYRDLMIKNNTDSSYLLNIWIEKNRLCGQWRCNKPLEMRYEVFQKEHWITCETGNHYVRHNKIYRKTFVLKDGKEELQNEELVTENHALMMYEPLLEDSKNVQD